MVYTRDKSCVQFGERTNDLHIDCLWPGALAIADHLKAHPGLCQGKYVLELGAGAALPSCVASKMGAEKVVITDYPADSVIGNIRNVVKSNNLLNAVAEPFIWGDDALNLLTLSREAPLGKYHLIILAELLWKDTYNLHDNLLKSVSDCLCRHNGQAIAAFVHRVTKGHTEENNMEFFTKAKTVYGMHSTYLGTNTSYKDVDDGVEEEADTCAVVHMFSLYYNPNLISQIAEPVA